MKRVLYLLNHAGRGGTEQYIRTLIEAMDGVSIRAELACNEEGALSDWARERGLPVHSLEMTGPFDRKAVRSLAALCRSREIDVVHTHFLRENFIALQAKPRGPKGLRVIYTYHILTHNSSVQKLCNRLLSRRQDAAVANCTAGARRLTENGVPAGVIHLIYNAVDPEVWQDPASDIRSELGIGPDDFVFLFAARLVEGKGHDWLLESTAALRQRTDRPFRLLLAGDGPLREELEEKVRQLGLGDVVTFLGFRSDMSNLYHGADLTVCPSESETLSLLLLESLACGTPALASEVGGIPDILSPEHDCGRLISYGDREALTESMKELMDSPSLLARWGDNAIRVVAEKFSTETQCRRMLSLYEGREDPLWM